MNLTGGFWVRWFVVGYAVTLPLGELRVATWLEWTAMLAAQCWADYRWERLARRDANS